MSGSEMNSGREPTDGDMSSVWRIGETVHRESGPSTPHFHRLLALLHSKGETRVPMPLGMDDEGREVVTYLPGDVGSSPPAGPHRRDEVLVQAGRLLSAIHDATVEVAGQWLAGWRAPVREPVEMICHGDFAPHNCVFVDGDLAGVFDFDFAPAGPAPVSFSLNSHSRRADASSYDAGLDGIFFPLA